MNASVGELDIALLDAVHVNPRVSFEELGRALDLSPVTAARRWRRLVDGGYAWVSSAVGPRLPVIGALFECECECECECEPGRAASVADELAAVPQAFSVHLTTGGYDVYALVVAADQTMLARLLVDVLPAVPRLRGVQSSAISQVLSGTRWRLGGISSDQASALAPDPADGLAEHTFDDVARAAVNAGAWVAGRAQLFDESAAGAFDQRNDFIV